MTKKCALEGCEVEFEGRSNQRFCCLAHKKRENHRKYRAKYPEKIKEYYANNAEKFKEYNTNRKYESPASYIRDLQVYAKRRCKKTGREFDPNSIKELLENPPTHCPYCLDEIDYTRSESRNKSPSLDRMDNTKGYTEDNVEVVCHRCNTIKGDGTALELRRIAERMESFGLA